MRRPCLSRRHCPRWRDRRRLRPDTAGYSTRPLLSHDVASLDSSVSIPLAAARYHGDQAAEPGMLDFAVNVRHTQPPALACRAAGRTVDRPGAIPGRRRRARGDPAQSPPVTAAPDEVALLAGAAEGFALLPQPAPDAGGADRAVVHRT